MDVIFTQGIAQQFSTSNDLIFSKYKKPKEGEYPSS